MRCVLSFSSGIARETRGLQHCPYLQEGYGDVASCLIINMPKIMIIKYQQFV